MTVRIRLAVSLLLAVALAGCAAPAEQDDKNLPPVDPRAGSLKEGFSTMDRLVEAAKREGALTVAGLPHDWVGFGEIISTFSDRYGIKVRELEPGASSRRQVELAAAKEAVNRPDVLDLSLDVAVANARRFAPYRVQTWQDIPDHLKDHRGAWYAGYGGYVSIGYDARKVPAPAAFADLLKPGYVVALPGDPRRTAAAFHGVMAASLATSSVGSTSEAEETAPEAAPEAADAAQPSPSPSDDGSAHDASAAGTATYDMSASGASAARGVRYFERLRRAGNLAAPGKAPTVVLDWDFLNTARAKTDGSAWRVVVPRDAVLGSYYVQAINKTAPHPAAARLWQEFLHSDEGQNLFLKGYARPARMEALQMKDTLDRDAAGELPALPPATRPFFLTIPETDAAKTHLSKAWPRRVG